MDNTMLQKYYNKMTEIIRLKYPKEDIKKIKEFVIKSIKENFEENENFKLTYEVDGIVLHKNNREELTIKEFDEYVMENKPIINGYGTLFKRHDQYDNILAKMIRELKAKRKVYKKKMFEHINDEDQTLKENYDSRQKTTKILNNSFYGATAEANSIFYHPHFGPSVTYAGEDLVTTAAKTFESFLGNNILFETVNDVIVYINNIAREKYSSASKINIERDIDVNTLVKYFDEHLVQKEGFEIIEEFLNEFKNNYKKLYKDYFKRFYYKNNFMELLKDSDINEKYFDKLIGKYDFLDPNEPPENIKPVLDELWNVLSDYIFYNYQDFYRFKRIESGKRKVVLTIKYISCH